MCLRSSGSDRATSFLTKRAPFWSLVLAVVATAGAFTMAAMAFPQLTNVLQSQRDYALLVTPSALTANQGSMATATITISSINGYDLATGLTASVPPSGTGWLTLALSHSTVTPSIGGKVDTILTITTLPGTPIGTYQVTISSFGGTKSHTGSVSVTVAPADFTITPQPSSLTITQGGYNTTTLIVASQGGFTGNVSLSATTPLASIGVAGGPSPLTITPGGAATSILAVSPTSLTNPGTYTLTVTGKAGALTHSVNIQVIVKTSSGGFEYLNLDAYAFASSTNVTLSLRNAGAGDITFASYYVKDASGNQYVYTSWNGPTIPSNQVASVNFLIGSSCPSCTLVGSAFTFMPGNSYTITIVTTRNNQFTFTVVR